MARVRIKYFWIVLSLIFLPSCDGGLNLFSIEDDVAFGLQIDDEIRADSVTYPILSEDDYPEAYSYLRGIRDEILNGGGVEHRDDFVWQVAIIEDDSVLNAFATPGGYLYFYTGLIKYLDIEDDFAGVMAHEIAHSDQRHTTEALTRDYGITLLLEILLGENQNALTNLAYNLTSLQYSRDAESEADESSVAYLSFTEYQCNGAAGFFEKLIAEEDTTNPPEFLSTHPDPANRVADINETAVTAGCDTTPSGNDFEAFQNMIP